MVKIEEKVAFQKLLLRRDIMRFVFDLRCYRQITNSHDNGDFKVNDYLSHIDIFSDWHLRLRSLLDRAKAIGANPNLLDEYQDDLVKRVNELRETCSPEEKVRLGRISNELTSMAFVCKGARTLCEELVAIYPVLKKRDSKDLVQEIEKAILYLTKTFVQYDNCSIEYFFFMDSVYCTEWFYECFEAYFTKSTIPKEEHQRNMRYLIVNVIKGYKGAQEKISKILDHCASLGIAIDKDTFIDLIEARIEASFKGRLLLNIRKNPDLMPFTVGDYLDILFDDLIKDKYEMHHSDNSFFSNRKPSIEDWNKKYLNKALQSIIIPLCRVSTISMEDFFRLLGSKIALLSDHLEVASNMSDYLKTLSPDYSGVFEEAYLEASERLPEERTRFVLTLAAIKESKNSKST